MATKHLLFALLSAVLLAGAGWAVLSANDSGIPADVAWGPADEEHVVAGEVPDALAAANGEAGDARLELAGADLAMAQPEGERPEVAVTGRVIDAFGRPLAAARVALEIRRGRGAPGANRVRKPVETGSDGRFSFRGPGFDGLSVSLLVAHANHAPLVAEKTFEEGKTDLDVGDLQMPVGATLIGSVTDAGGVGIPGATLQLEPQRSNRLTWVRDRSELVPPVYADQNGSFRIAHVMPGDWRIEASAPQRERGRTEVFSLADGDEEHLDPIRLGPGFQITGTVYAPKGEVLASAEVSLNGRGNHRTQTDAKGSFAFDHLPAGEFELRVAAQGCVTHHQRGIDPRSATPLVIRLEEGLAVAGVVRDARTGSPITRYAARIRRVGGLNDERFDVLEAQLRENFERMQAVTVELGRMREGEAGGARSEELRTARRRLDEFRREIEVAREERGPRGRREGGRPGLPPGDIGEVVARPEGEFVFEGLDEGVYEVDVDAPDYQRARTDAVEVRVGAPRPNVALQIDAGRRVSGSVVTAVDGVPLADAVVQLVMLEPDGARQEAMTEGRFLRGIVRGNRPPGAPILQAQTDAQGRFAWTQAPPGRFVVTARAARHAEAQSEAFELVTEKAGIELELGALARLHGVVKGVPPERAAEARVVVFGGLGNMRTVEVAADGGYKIDDLQPGGYVVRAIVGTMRAMMNREMRGMFRAAAEPGATGPAFDVTLEHGEEQRFDPVAMIEPVGALTGTILQNGAPGKALRVSLRPVEEAPDTMMWFSGRGDGGGRMSFAGSRHEVRTNQKGEFAFSDVPEGAYVLQVHSTRVRQRELLRQEVFVRREAANAQTLSVLTADLTGEIHEPGSDEPSQLDGVLRLYAGATARPQDPAAYEREHAVQTVRFSQGKFEALDLPAADYWAVVTVRGRPEAERALTVSPGAPRVVLTAGEKPSAAKG